MRQFYLHNARLGMFYGFNGRVYEYPDAQLFDTREQALRVSKHLKDDDWEAIATDED